MLPVLVTIGDLPISSFGLFMAIAFLSSILTLWKIAKVYEIDQEKIVDLTLITFIGGLICARLYFVALNWDLFGSFSRVIFINRYPGLSFWGGLLGGFLTLWYVVKRFRLRFWEVADFAAVAFLVGMIWGNIGCFLGGCAYGKISNLFFATPITGLIGRRFPTPMIEAVILLIVFLYLKKKVMEFHFAGKIVALFMIFTGIIKFFLEFFRGDSRGLVGPVTYGHVLSILSLIVGTSIFYSLSKRNFLSDLKGALLTPFDPKRRGNVMLHLSKNWYNYTIVLGQTIKRSKQNIFRKLHVKPTPKEY